MILVDTNAWVHFIRNGDVQLAQLLKQSRVFTCDVVLCELVLGSGLPRHVSDDLFRLPVVPSPTAQETRDYINRHARLFVSSGVGWADAQIIVAAAKVGARIYTSDDDVRRIWRALGFKLA